MSYHSNPVNHSCAPPKKLQIALLNAIHNNKTYLLEVSFWITISELKSKIEKAFGIPVAQQRLFYQTQELNQNNFMMANFAGKKAIKMILRPTPNLENTLGLIKKYETLPREEHIEGLLGHVQEGFNLGLIPKLTFDGTSGSYFLQNKYRKNVAIFKPFDEEPFAPNNPKGYIGKLGSNGFKTGILSGESAIREVAAYLLDEKGFSGVPQTTFVEVVHPYFSKRGTTESEISATQSNSMIPIENFSQYTGQDKKIIIKHGSLQKFVEGAEEASDYGPRMFPDDEVRKIALLDLRILNCDRNEGNILVKKEKGMLHLIPIDHGLCFPDCFNACTYDLVWMEWPQVKKKWNPIELDYISRINPKADADKLMKLFKFRSICIRNFRIAQTVIKKFAMAGLTLFDIGNFMYRDDPDFPSPLEEAIKKTEGMYHSIKSTVPKSILQTLSKCGKKKLSNKGHFREEGKENEGKKVMFDLPGRSRAYSESVNFTSEMFQTVLETSNTNLDSPTNELFTIPELELTKDHSTPCLPPSKNGLTVTNPKSSFVSKTSSKGGESDFSSTDEDEDKDNNDSLNNLKHEKRPRRSSSIPASLSRLSTHDSLTNDANDEKTEKKEKEKPTLHNGCRNGLKRLYKKTTSVDHNDELFFKYFDNLLDHKIEVMTKKQNVPTRSRFYSDAS